MKHTGDFAAFLQENRFLIASLAVAAGFCFFLWRFTSSPLSDFGLNAFTEVIGIVLTVFLVDQIIKRREDKRLLPLQLAAFRDVQLFVNEIITFWINVYNWSGKDELPPPPEAPSTVEFISISYFREILKRLNLDAEACVTPKRSWWDYLPQQEKEHRTLGEKILERHSGVLDPKAYHLVHKILNGLLNPNVGLSLLPVHRQIGGGFGDEQYWNSLPEGSKNRLGRYYLVIEDDLKDLAELYNWYLKMERVYSKVTVA